MRTWLPLLALSLSLLGGPAFAQKEAEKGTKENKSAAKAKGVVKLIDLNTASEAELRQLPGVDAALAKKIMDNRPYITVEDLARSGIPVEVVRDARTRVTVTAREETGAQKSQGSSDRRKEK